MFGTSVIGITQMAVGTYGYVIRIDTTALRSYDITGVQAQSSAIFTPAPTMTEVSLDILMSYLEDSECPDLAYHYGYGEVYIFFKTTVFAYATDTRFALIGKRNPIKLTSLDDNLDIADKDLDLFVAYVLKYAAILSRQAVPFEIEKTIKQKEQEIKNANSTEL
jgi:hypothetical protein